MSKGNVEFVAGPAYYVAQMIRPVLRQFPPIIVALLITATATAQNAEEPAAPTGSAAPAPAGEAPTPNGMPPSAPPPGGQSPSATPQPNPAPAPPAATSPDGAPNAAAPVADASVPPSAPPEGDARAAQSQPEPASGPPAASPAPAEPEAEIFEPPLPRHVEGEPVLPPIPRRVAPNNSLWLGARAGWLFPMGSLWQDGEPIGGICCAYYNRGWDDFASSGPMLEIDIGARLAHGYNLFGLWEYGLLGDGDELRDQFGGQTSADSHFLGLGLRFSTDPDDFGILVEMALGWRRFSATWGNGTEFTATDDFFNTRIAFGADIRINESLALSPMVTFGGGVFGKAEWKLADGSREGAFSSFGDFLVDEPGQHIPVSIQVGIHYDAFGSRD